MKTAFEDNNLSMFQRSIIESVMGAPTTLGKSEKKHRKTSVGFVEPKYSNGDAKEELSLSKSITNILNGPKDSVERLAFTVDPSNNNQYQGLYKQKLRLLPDNVLKRLQIQDDLVAAITNTRGNQIATFGRRQPDRFSIGFAIEPNAGVVEKMTPEQREELAERIDAAEVMFLNCGSTKRVEDKDKLTFAQYLYMNTRNAVGVGRQATEIIYVSDLTGEKRFHSFRPVDAGTIYRAAPQKEAAQALRDNARHLLETISNQKLDPERFQNDEYAWIQVHDGRPLQAFTEKECLVHNFYPVNDVELDGYPVTPLDTVISAVTTHINITSHNKMYFQTGRASRGMLVIKSDDIDENVISRIKQQFNASINSVSNAFRMPVFGVGSEDEISWQPIDSGSRDMEFQFLSDSNARTIMSAFQMSPEELPGWSHLSRGTNSQSLSEANTEYLLTAHRDVGLRPLLGQWQDFCNSSLFPLIDPNLSKICTFKFLGLDAVTAEKESIRLQQDAPVHMTYNEILDKVEKKGVERALGGDFPINPQYQQILDKYVKVGVIVEKMFGIEGASTDPTLQYYRDPFWMQYQQMMQQQAQQQKQEQMQQQQMQQQTQQMSQQAPQPGQEVADGADQANAALGKSEAQLHPNARALLARQNKVVNNFMGFWESESAKAINDVIEATKAHG
ncbi:Bacteriophage/Gene transfer agent portal protein [uncultured Caudovirales phage]|uniref:Bacteriophage/Gene transfer agent portal protein n=1 Tax=uncultured Caudovirales phage TaxID=2100421 RepID=A0A6J5L1Z9_9CAUD|nr:Bacteriophage/Gene transfer agent portal protein [uncultured Caudovirales phage]